MNQADLITARSIVQRHTKHLAEGVEATQDQDTIALVVALEVVLAAAEQVERARFSSEELVHACHDSYASTPPDVISYRAFAAGFDNGAAWVVQRMKGEE